MGRWASSPLLTLTPSRGGDELCSSGGRGIVLALWKVPRAQRRLTGLSVPFKRGGTVIALGISTVSMPHDAGCARRLRPWDVVFDIGGSSSS